MKQFLTGLAMLMLTFALHAQTKMIIRDTDGNITTCTLQQGGIIEFDEGGIEAVDLGLPSGTLWGSCNVGALHPEDSGAFFAWGEQNDKPAYSLSQYKLYDHVHGTYPYEETLEDIAASAYDGATSQLGHPWKIPTRAQVDELLKKCSWAWGTTGGMAGYTVTGPNGSTIFLPAAGKRVNEQTQDKGTAGYFWASALADRSDNEAFTLEISSTKHAIDYEFRYLGLPIRPVK